MTRLEVELTPVDLAMTRPVTTARGVARRRKGFLIAMSDGDGHRGWAEALPLPGWPGHDLARTATALSEAVERLQGLALEDAAEALNAHVPDDLPAAAALDIAWRDLDARRRGIRFADTLGEANATVADEVRVNALVVGDDAEAVADSAHRANESGYDVAKLKVGGDPSLDIARVEALADTFDGRLRLDANTAWDPETARQFLERLPGRTIGRIEYLEEPVADLSHFAGVREESPVPLALDEHLGDPGTARRVIEEGLADVLVIKPVWLGPLATTLDLAARASDAEIDIVVTSALDSTAGITAALHVAAALPEPRRAAGLATADLVEPTLHPSPTIKAGAIPLPNLPGLAIDPI